MSEPNPQAQAATEPPPTATEETLVETPAAEPNATLTQDLRLTEQDVAGLDAKAYREAAEAFRSGKDVEAQAPQEAEPEQQDPAAEPTEQPPAEDPNHDAPKAEETEEPDATKEPAEPDRIRLNAFDDRQRESILLVRKLKSEGKTISLSEAERRVAILHGDDPATDAPAQDPAKAPATSEIQSKLDKLRIDYKDAAKAVDTERMADLQVEMEAVRDELAEARHAEAQAAQKTATDLDAEKTRLLQRYPDFAKADSPLSQKWLEINSKLESEKHPILNDPVAAMRYITLLAADEIGIAPASAKPSPKASTSIPATPVVRKPPIQPASGAARTTTPANPTALLERQIDGVKNLRDYEALKEKLLAPA